MNFKEERVTLEAEWNKYWGDVLLMNHLNLFSCGITQIFKNVYFLVV